MQVKLLGPNVDSAAVTGVAKSAKIFYPPKNFPLVSPESWYRYSCTAARDACVGS